MALSSDTIAAVKKKLDDLQTKEAEVLAVAGMKNELEASIYGSREKVEREDIMQVSTEQQREEVTKLCTEYEEWMYEAGSTKSDYESRLTKLQDLLGPMEERALELEARPDLQTQVVDEIADMKKTHAHIKKNMTWVSANKTEAALAKLTEFEEWWAKKEESQKSLPLHEAPAYTKKEVVEKLTKMQKEWDKLKNTKKPKESKAKAGKNQTKGTDEASKELSTDPAVIEKELKEVREKKSAAVEGEDFDTAHQLKQTEQVLVKHLEKLKAGKADETAEEKTADEKKTEL